MRPFLLLPLLALALWGGLACGAETCGCAEGGPCGCDVCFCDGSYKTAHNAALADGKPFVVFVGQPAYAVPGAHVCSVASYCGVRQRCVVVGLRNSAMTDMEECQRIDGSPGWQSILYAAGYRPLMMIPAYRLAAGVGTGCVQGG